MSKFDLNQIIFYRWWNGGGEGAEDLLVEKERWRVGGGGGGRASFLDYKEQLTNQRPQFCNILPSRNNKPVE